LGAITKVLHKPEDDREKAEALPAGIGFMHPECI